MSSLLEFSIAKYTTSQWLLQIRKFVQQKKRKDIDGKSFFNTVIPLTILSDWEGDFLQISAFSLHQPVEQVDKNISPWYITSVVVYRNNKRLKHWQQGLYGYQAMRKSMDKHKSIRLFF